MYIFGWRIYCLWFYESFCNAFEKLGEISQEKCYFIIDFNPASEAVETAAAIEVVAETERKDDDKD